MSKQTMTARPIGRGIAVLVVAAAAAGTPLEAAALLWWDSASTNKTVDATKTAKRMARCDQFKLKEVHVGTAPEARTYWFKGVCTIWTVKYVGGKEQGRSGEAKLWSEAKATYNAKTGAHEERVKLTDPAGKHSGDLQLGFKCLQDPVVGSASCVRMTFKNMTDWDGFSVPADKNRPMLAGTATAAEADKLAKSAAPPPKPAVAAPPQAAPVPPPLQKAGTQASLPPPGAAAVDPSPKPGAVELPDLHSGAQVVVAGMHAVSWGGSVQVSDAVARAASSGICQVAFEHQIRNGGASGSAASSRQWTIEGTPDGLADPTPAIAAGGSLARVDTLPLRPGVNKLRLKLDSLEQVAEANENNNVYALVVTVSGLCGGLPPGSPQPAGGPGNLRWAPEQRAPGSNPASVTTTPPASRLQIPPPTR
jgi:hypothetical protein